MTKIIFNEVPTEAVKKTVDLSKNVCNHISTRVASKVEPDVYSSGVKTVIPFYNRFLPKVFRRTQKIEFYPDTQIAKSIDTLNADGKIIKSKSFDNLGNLTYSEKINPKTGHSKIWSNADGTIIEQEMQGSILLKKSVCDVDGNAYRYEFEPKSGREVINEVKDGHTIITKKIHGKQIYRFESTPEGIITEDSTDILTKISYRYEAGIIKYGDGTVSKTPKFKRLTVSDADRKSSAVYEFIPEEKIYSCTAYNSENGAQIGEVKYLRSPEMRMVLDRIAGHN